MFQSGFRQFRHDPVSRSYLDLDVRHAWLSYWPSASRVPPWAWRPIPGSGVRPNPAGGDLGLLIFSTGTTPGMLAVPDITACRRRTERHGNA